MRYHDTDPVTELDEQMIGETVKEETEASLFPERRLETALLNFIEEYTRVPHPDYTKLVPEMAQELINLWEHICPK